MAMIVVEDVMCACVCLCVCVCVHTDSMLASGPHLNTGGPGLETLEEEEEKARFFERLEAGASSTLDYSKLNRELDSPGSTTTTAAAAASLRYTCRRLLKLSDSC